MLKYDPKRKTKYDNPEHQQTFLNKYKENIPNMKFPERWIQFSKYVNSPEVLNDKIFNACIRTMREKLVEKNPSNINMSDSDVENELLMMIQKFLATTDFKLNIKRMRRGIFSPINIWAFFDQNVYIWYQYYLDLYF